MPDQTPEETLRLLRAHLDEQGFQDVKIKFLGGEAPARTDPDDPFVQLVVDAAEEPYGQKMQIVPDDRRLGPEPRLHGDPARADRHRGAWVIPAAQAHAPNENVRLDLYLKGAKHIGRILKEFGN